MKLTVASSVRAAPSSSQTACVESAAPAVAAVVRTVHTESAMLQAAGQQMARLPEIDAARVAEIKLALSRGEIQFDPCKLAGLVVRHHRGRG